MDFESYLHSENLQVSDPYDQENLRPREKITAAANSVVFDNFYRQQKEKVFCHIGGGYRHNNGITGILESGERILFGSKCSQDFFGPEITKLCAADLRRRTKSAKNRYTLTVFKNSASKIENWLSSYGILVKNCQEIWIEIRRKHPEPFRNIMEHIARNNGRLIRFHISEVGGNALRKDAIQTQEIITAIASHHAIPQLTQLRQRLEYIEFFCNSVETFNVSDDPQLLNNSVKMLKRAEVEADLIDASLTFSHDFLSDTKLKIISDWLEEKRVEKLVDVNQIKKRDFVAMVRRISGHAFPLPGSRLGDCIRSCKAPFDPVLPVGDRRKNNTHKLK